MDSRREELGLRDSRDIEVRLWIAEGKELGLRDSRDIELILWIAEGKNWD